MRVVIACFLPPSATQGERSRRAAGVSGGRSPVLRIAVPEALGERVARDLQLRDLKLNQNKIGSTAELPAVNRKSISVPNPARLIPVSGQKVPAWKLEGGGGGLVRRGPGWNGCSLTACLYLPLIKKCVLFLESNQHVFANYARSFSTFACSETRFFLLFTSPGIIDGCAAERSGPG